MVEGVTLACERPAGVTGSIASLWHDRRGVLWVATDAGLFANGVRREAGAVTALLEAADGGLWAGFASGTIAHLNGAAVQRYGAAQGLPDRGFVAALLEDREGSVWIATSNGGLSRLKPKRVVTYTTADGLPAPVVGSIVQDTAGEIWAATACGPPARLQQGRFVPQWVTETSAGCLRELLVTRDGSLWIAGRGGGALRWDGTRLERFGPREGLSDAFVSALFEDREGRVWIGTETGGVHVVENGRLSRAFTEADGIATHHVAAFAQDREGRIWIGSNANGLSIYEHGKFRTLSPEESPPSRNIAGLLLDSRGDLWIGTAADGLFRRRNGKYEPFGLAQGLGDRLVAVMIEDRDSNLWVGTAHGIARLERARIEAVAAGTAASLEPIILDRSDGMVETEGSGGGFDPSGLRDRDGRLWFSTIDGIVVVDPAAFAINRLVAPVVIEEARFDNASEASPVDGAVVVPAGTQSIELSYTAFSLLAPSKVKFRYRLDGFHSEWQEVGARRTAYFTRLPPGDYTFEVMAANNDGVWNEVPVRLGVTVEPFFWERTDARLAGLVLLLIGTGFGAQAAAQRRARRRVAELEHEQALTRERTRIARDLHDDLGSRLAQIALMAEDRRAEASTDRIAGVARDAMQTMDELVWTVNARNDTVESFAAYAAEFVEEHLALAGLRYRLQIQANLDGELSADPRRHLFLAFKEAIHNIVKHAGATEVRVRLAVEDGTLTLAVSDNGRGLPESERNGLGNGMRNMRERMAAAGGTFTVDSPAGGGTTVVFKMPLV
jgi:signal transduction histidine kinase